MNGLLQSVEFFHSPFGKLRADGKILFDSVTLHVFRLDINYLAQYVNTYVRNPRRPTAVKRSTGR